MLQLGTSGIFLNFQISLYCTAAEIKFFSHLKKKKKKSMLYSLKSKTKQF